MTPLHTSSRAARRPARRISLAALTVLVLLGAGLAGVGRADKGVTEGGFRDRDGKEHRWQIRRSHLLEWEGKPYAPAGVVFRSAYLKAPSPETLSKDEEELGRLKAAGIQDIWIEPQRGLLENSVEQTQALVDLVERQGFRYGLKVGDRYRGPLVGFLPSSAPQAVPQSRLRPGARLSWEIAAPQGRRVVYALVESQPDERIQNYAIASGEVVVERDAAQIEVQLRNSKLLGRNRGLLYTLPEVQVEPEELGSYGDLWSGMEDYSTRLRAYLKQVKWGPGLRFILDPFTAGDGTVGQEDQVFPSSDSFRAAYREWLQKKFGGAATLNVNWRLTDRRLLSLDEAARLIPMWPRNDAPEGDGWLLDSVEKVAYRCKPRDSRIWRDLDDFRAETLKRWMNTVTNGVKQEGPNVPMLFTWAAYHPVFTNSPSPSGYDGLGAQLSGSAASVVRESAAYALAQAEEADRNTWLIATRLSGPSEAAPAGPAAGEPAYSRKGWDSLVEAGYRGVYLDPEQVPDAAARATELGAAIAANPDGMDQTIQVCFFPMPLATADRVTRLSTGVWWLPSGAPARLLQYGDTVMGYQITRPFGTDSAIREATILWSTVGKQEVSFLADEGEPAEWFDSAGKPIKVPVKKKQARVVLSGEPVIATGVDPVKLFPLELANRRLEEFDELIRQAEAQGLDTANWRTVYTDVKKSLVPANAVSNFDRMGPFVQMLRDELTPYLWLEGERSASHNFTGVAFQAGCSLGTYLKLDRLQAPTNSLYKARYVVNVRRDASYDIWVAGKLPGRPGVSPLIWQVDEEPAVVLENASGVGGDYAPGMTWYSLGKVALKAGRHELLLVVPQKSDNQTGRFAAGIDAIVFSRVPFQPKGAEKPYVRATPSVPRREEDADEGERAKRRREEIEEAGKGKESKRKGDREREPKREGDRER